MEMNIGNSLVFLISLIFLALSLHFLIKKINEQNIVLQKKNDQKQTKLQANVQTNLLNTLHNFDMNTVKDKLSVVSYNILSQKFAKLNKRLCQENINFDNRLRVILKEITDLNSDVICLQEVNIEVLNQFFMRPLIMFGYTVLYGKNEGSTFLNLTAFKSSKFRLISYKNFNVCLENHSNLFIGNRGVFKVELIQKSTNKSFVVYNVHFPWRPHLEYIKCVILNMILDDIRTLYNNLQNIIICGDFNSLPTSLVLKMMYFDMEKNFFEITKEAFANNKCNEEENKSKRLFFQVLRQPKEKENFEKILANLEKLSYKFHFRSAYENYRQIKKNSEFFEQKINYEENHPEFTNFTGKFCGNIDYIFYSQNLYLSKILNLVSKDDLKNEAHLPSSKYPSDHLKIYAEFLIK